MRSAKRLVATMSLHALEALTGRSIRLEPIERDGIELFWSRSANMV